MKKLIIILFLIAATTGAMEKSFSDVGDTSERDDIFLGLDDICQIDDLSEPLKPEDKKLIERFLPVGEFSQTNPLTKDEHTQLDTRIKNSIVASEALCWLCNKKFKDKRFLRKHEADCHKKQTYVCMSQIKEKDFSDCICLEKKFTLADITAHRRSHRFIFCPVCDEKFLSVGCLKTHCGKYHPKQNYFCLMCNPIRGFIWEYDLYYHLKSIHQLISF